jgi:hypothetical protein
MPTPFPGMDPYVEQRALWPINHYQDPEPPLEHANALWSDALLSQAGLR